MYLQNSRKVPLWHLKTTLTVSLESECELWGGLGDKGTWSESLDELLEVFTEFFFLASFVVGDFQTLYYSKGIGSDIFTVIPCCFATVGPCISMSSMLWGWLCSVQGRGMVETDSSTGATTARGSIRKGGL